MSVSFWKGNRVGLIASFQTNRRGQQWECVEKHSLHVIMLGLEDNRRVVISFSVIRLDRSGSSDKMKEEKSLI